MVIWKYELRWGENVLEMGRETKLLTAQLQQGKIMLWAIVVSHPSAVVGRRVVVRNTGDKFSETGSYLATIQDGTEVVHVFDLGETD